MSLTDLLTISAATWWVSYVLTSSDGPLDVFKRLREWRSGRWHGRSKAYYKLPDTDTQYGAAGYKDRIGLLDCIICTSIWIAVVFTLAPMGWVTQAAAVAGVALWVHGFTGWKYSA